MRTFDFAGVLGTWARGDRPLYVELADALRAAVERRDLPPGTRLPAERELARLLVVSRNTVAGAYEALKGEGYLESRQGSGTRVCIVAEGSDSEAPVAKSLPRLASLWQRGAEPAVVNLTRSGFRGFEDVPREMTTIDPDDLARLIDDSVGYSREGLPELRIEIARWMTRAHLPTTAEQVLVTTGAQQAINLLTTVYVRPGDRVILENPTYYGAIDSFRWADARLIPVSLGPHGPDVDQVVHLIGRHAPSLAYFTLSFHNPTGSVASDAVRRRLAAVASASALPMIDDLELASHFTDAPPPPPLAAYTDAPNVISVASMSKMFWAGLRVGWVRADPQVLAPVARAKVVADLGSALPTQLIAARMLRHGDVIAAARRAQLAIRRQALEEAIAELLPDWTYDPPAGGVFLWLRLPSGDGGELSELAERYGVLVQPGATLSADGRFNDYVRLPFVEQPDTIRIGVARLARAWAAYRRGSPLVRRASRRPAQHPLGGEPQDVVGAVIRG
jgi:DNA-binding transcriptional MocR family regulator